MARHRWLVDQWCWLLAMSTLLCLLTGLGAAVPYDEASGSSDIPFWAALSVASLFSGVAGYLSPKSWFLNAPAILLPFLLKTLLSGLELQSFLRVEIYLYAVALVVLAGLSFGGAITKSKQVKN